jgi:hypothetical protein
MALQFSPILNPVSVRAAQGYLAKGYACALFDDRISDDLPRFMLAGSIWEEEQ